MKRSWRNAARRQRGTSLIEILVVATVLGLLALMLAPLEAFLLRRLREARHGGQVERAARLSTSMLSEDLRMARAVTTEGPGSLTLTTRDARDVAWTVGPAGLCREQRRTDGSKPIVRCFRSIDGLDVERPRANLVAVTLSAAGGANRTLEVCLRDERGLP